MLLARIYDVFPLRWEATGSEHDPAADPLLQSAPAFEFDQRIAW